MAGHRIGSRSVVDEPAFVNARAAIVKTARQWDAFWWAAEWGLALDPGGFDQVDANLWVIICEPSRRADMPRLRVYYSFDDAYIYLKWVELG